MLVAPVIEPGATERTLYLPEGRWLDLWRSADAGLKRLHRPAILAGGREVTVPAPLDELPMFVRVGSQLELLPRGGPTWREAKSAGRTRRSLLGFGGRKLEIAGARERSYRVQWALPSRPDRLELDGDRVPFRYEGGVLRAKLDARRGALTAR